MQLLKENTYKWERPEVIYTADFQNSCWNPAAAGRKFYYAAYFQLKALWYLSMIWEDKTSIKPQGPSAQIKFLLSKLNSSIKMFRFLIREWVRFMKVAYPSSQVFWSVCLTNSTLTQGNQTEFINVSYTLFLNYNTGRCRSPDDCKIFLFQVCSYCNF